MVDVGLGQHRVVLQFRLAERRGVSGDDDEPIIVNFCLQLTLKCMLTFLPLQIELGTACGKLFRCSTMAVLDAGDSDILSGQTA